jgi:hypothetical protein
MKSVIKIPVSNKAKNFLISREVVFSLFDKLSKFDSDLELDFSNIEFISRSYADQFHKAKNDFENKHNSKIHILNAKDVYISSLELRPEGGIGNTGILVENSPRTKLVSNKIQLTPPTFINQISKPIFTPIFCFWIFFAVILILSLLKNKFVSIITTGLDFTILFVTGALGILFIFMWFGTDHIMTKNNYNILSYWA